ncbi:MAG: DUF554 domain-containing protein [Candidatus Tectomicrobia bacterium]|uniref:DUF554 domain-containing protein n=1 Tax=Tectimicrobiota bacterium TaxID=2528274 RepID=A0A932GQJ8_UNCTE|nr:DUF554 domain-containing protein [Candidatus Tectomicrobia bacterium]
MTGTLVNVVAVLVGSSVGMAIGKRIPEGLKKGIISGLGLATLLIGIQMALKTGNILIPIASIVLGGLVGELLQIETFLEQLAERLRGYSRSGSSTFVTGFITASLVFCVGSMTIVGSLQEGINGDSTLLITKSLMDGTASIAFASTLGIGVAFSALTVLIVQGSLTLLGQNLAFLLSGSLLNEMTAAGGLMIIGIGFLLLDIKKLKIANFLPALIIAPALAWLFP